MPKNEDGEFELVLGNHQLFGVFFIVVMLFGVFFVMGYIVGQNSAPQGRTDVAVHKETKPLVVDSPGRPEETSSPAPAETAPAPVGTAAQQPAPVQAPPVKAKEPEKAPPPKAPAPAPPPTRTTSNQPVPGESYLQLAATNRDQADGMVDVLRMHGFQALDYEAPEKPGIFRVLVGPIKDGEQNKVRADLQGKGFQGREAIPKKF